MAIIKFKELGKIRLKHRKDKIVLVTGAFDLLHAGHILFFENCKKIGKILVVGLGSDKGIELSKNKGRPILNQQTRLKMLDSTKYVDYCFLDTISDKKPYLYILEPAFSKLKPDFYVVNNDASQIDTRKAICLKHGVKLVIKERTCPPEFDYISTTRIIEKIKNI